MAADKHRRPAFHPPRQFRFDDRSGRVTEADLDGLYPEDLPESWVDSTPHLNAMERATIEAFVLAHRRGRPAHPGVLRDVADMLERLLEGEAPDKVFTPQFQQPFTEQTRKILNLYDQFRAAGQPHWEACETVAKAFPNRAGKYDPDKDIRMAEETVDNHVKRRRNLMRD